MRVKIVVAAVVLALFGPLRPQLRATGNSCSAVSFTAKLDAGQSFSRKVGGLEFKIRATHDKAMCNGWRFTLDDAGGDDFIYPVNMPLRFNPSQFLSCSYGLTAKQGLEMKRNMRFILTEPDYRRLSPLLEDALWPADSHDPDHAGEKYMRAIGSVRTGLIRINTVQFKLSPNGLIRSATFGVELIAPASFHFEPGLKPYSTPCSPVGRRRH